MLYLNQTPISITKFPDKTSQVWKISDFENIMKHRQVPLITWEFEAEEEFLQLAQLKTLIDTITPYCTLYVPFLPYGRQDKKVSNETTFGLTSFISLLKSLKFSRIQSIDMHSLVIGIDNIRPIDNISSALIESKADIICYPDRGAQLRYGDLFPKVPTIVADKKREESTGHILNMTIISDLDIRRKNIMITDDICDGGATFTAIAALLRDANKICLYTTHGIYSKGLTPLKEAGIQEIYNRKGRIL